MASETADFTLASDIIEHQILFDQVFNSGDADAVNAMYTEEAVSEWDPGNPLTGQARSDRVVEFLSYGPKLEADVLKAVEVGDLAYVIVRWTIDTTDADGRPEHLAGTAVDVLKRGEDGKWRYVIDNPFAISDLDETADQG